MFLVSDPYSQVSSLLLCGLTGELRIISAISMARWEVIDRSSLLSWLFRAILFFFWSRLVLCFVIGILEGANYTGIGTVLFDRLRSLREQWRDRNPINFLRLQVF